jgi:uncharacterized protein YicC (UPF0701 family)
MEKVRTMTDLDNILGGENLNTFEVEATDQEISRIAVLCKKQLDLEKEVDRLNELLAETQNNLVRSGSMIFLTLWLKLMYLS